MAAEHGAGSVPTNPAQGYGARGPARTAAALGLIGVETWCLIVLMPRIEHGAFGPSPALEWFANLLPLALLAAAVAGADWLSLAERRAMLVLGVPVALAASVAARPDLTEREAFGPLAATLVALSLAAYLVLALQVVERPVALRPTTSQPLAPDSLHPPAAAARNGRVVLGLLAAAALVSIALTFSSGRADALLRFGEAADDAVALAVLTSALLFSVAIGAVVGPGLRARKSREPAREALAPRLVPYLVIALVALLLRGALHYLDTR